jgi:hypothetical protein
MPTSSTFGAVRASRRAAQYKSHVTVVCLLAQPGMLALTLRIVDTSVTVDPELA